MIRTICSFTAGFTVAAWIGLEASPKFVDQKGAKRESLALETLAYASSAVAAASATYMLISKR